MKTVFGALALGFALLPFTALEASAHGCHRNIQEGRAGWHRHVGPDCERVEGRDWRRRDDDRRDRRPYCEKKCKYVGPIKICDTVCR